MKAVFAATFCLTLLVATVFSACTAKAHGDGWYNARIGPTPPNPRYETPYYDVDTMFLTIDLGLMGQQWYGSIRVRCIDGPEIRPLATREIATQQRDFGVSLAPEGQPVLVRFHGRGKYGRPVVDILVGGLNYAATVYAEFADTMELEAYGDDMIAECQEFLGIE